MSSPARGPVGSRRRSPKGWLWRLYGADSGSILGSSITEVAWPLLALGLLHASALEVSLLLAVEQVAWLVLGLSAGVLVDRWDRRSVLATCGLARAAVFAMVPLLWMSGLLTLEILFVLAAMSGIAYVFSVIASDALVPSLVERSGLTRANSVLSGLGSAADLVGKSAGGLLVAAISAPLTILIDSVLALVSAVLYRSLPSDRAPRHSRLGFFTELKEGLRYTFTHRLFALLTVSTAWSNAAVAAQYGLTVTFLSRTLLLPETLVGIVFGLSSVGSLIGAALTPRLASRFSSARMWRWSLLIAPAIGLLIPASFPGYGVLLFGMGYVAINVGAAISNILISSARHAICPPHLLGRLSASTMFITWGVIPLGLAAGGLLSTAIGIRGAMLVVSLAMFGPLVIVLLGPLRRVSDFSQFE